MKNYSKIRMRKFKIWNAKRKIRNGILMVAIVPLGMVIAGSLKLQRYLINKI